MRPSFDSFGVVEAIVEGQCRGGGAGVGEVPPPVEADVDPLRVSKERAGATAQRPRARSAGA